MNVVTFEQVKKSYASVHALSSLDFHIDEGEAIGLFGHNGAGKTTTMKLILGLIEPTAGKVDVFGQSPTGEHADTLRQKLGYLPENVRFYEQLTGEEVAIFFARLKKRSKQDARDILEKVGLAFAAKRRVRTYSKGMRQRLGLAQALLGDPKLLLFDEPTVGLDPVATREFYHIVDLLRQHGSSVILSSHVLAGVENHIQRAVILGKGQLLATGTLDELRQQAGLPLMIKAHGIAQHPQVESQLASYTDDIQKINGHALHIAIQQQDKLPVLRTLLDNPEIEDIDIHPPSLETLYMHFTQQHMQEVN